MKEDLGMKRYKITWRLNMFQKEAFQRYLDLLTNEGQAGDEIWLIISEPTTYGYEPLESIEKKCEVYKPLAAAARARGIRVGINPWPTFGSDEPENADMGRPQMPYQPMIGYDGSISSGGACPVSPEFLAYTRERYKLFAKTGCDFVWVDDDCRFTHLGKKTYPCFCSNCVQNFEKGAYADRETLVAELNRPENSVLRHKWNAYGAKRLAAYCKAVREAVDEVNPKIETPFMSVGYSHTTFSGDYIEQCMKELRAKAARPGHGFYCDNAPMGMFEKVIEMSRQIVNMPESVLADVQYEEESCPATLFNKAVDTRLMEMALSIWGGCTGIAMNHVYDTAEGPRPFDHLRYEVEQIKANRATFYDRYLTFVEGLPQRGVWGAFSEWAAACMKVGEKGWFNEDDPDYNTNHFINEWPNFGFPITADPKGAYATLLQGKTVEFFSDEELDELFKKPLFMDGLALQTIWERGYGEKTGVRIKVASPSGLEKIAQSAYDDDFAGAIRMGLSGLNYDLELLNDEVEVLAYRSRHYNIPDEICATRYGNIVVLGYSPYQYTGTPGRLTMMRNLQKAMGAPVWLEPKDVYDPPRVSIWVRADEKRAAVLLINAETSPTRSFDVVFRGEAKNAVSIGLNREEKKLLVKREDEFLYAHITELKPWEMAVVLFE